MDIRQLKYFHAVATELHFKKAAQKLFIVQPALSRQIRELEEELGTRLLNRNQRNVSLTAAGLYLKQAIEPLLQQLKELPHKVKLVADGLEGELRIGYTGSAVDTFLPGLLEKLNKQYPGIQTYLSESVSSTQLEALRNRQLDIAFLRHPPPDPALETLLVWREPFYLVLPKSHPLIARNFKSLQQVASAPFILPPATDGLLYHQHMLGICEEAGVHPVIAHESTHGHTTVKLVKSGLGISILPETFKKTHGEEVKFIPLKHTQRQAELTAVWLKDNPNITLKKLTGLFTLLPV